MTSINGLVDADARTAAGHLGGVIIAGVGHTRQRRACRIAGGAGRNRRVHQVAVDRGLVVESHAGARGKRFTAACAKSCWRG